MKAIIIAILMLGLACYCYADEELTLVDIIDLSPDSFKTSSIMPAGDFNADGYDDLLVGVYKGYPSWMEAGYLYFGGPEFDTEPDIIFYGDQQGELIGHAASGCKLQDFNGDGYNDLAISAGGHNHGDIYQGRTYIYFGSPDPDTVADLIIDGERYQDCMGVAKSGDFNNDNYSDILMVADNWVMGPRVFIYLGNATPDTICDLIFDYEGMEDLQISDIFGGFDLNGDEYDDYCYRTSLTNTDSLFIFWGDDSLTVEYDYCYSTDETIYILDDISGDGIGDLVRSLSFDCYLCLGGNEFNIEPDYFMWPNQSQSRPYNFRITQTDAVLLRDDLEHRKFILYDTGVPFDTTAIATFEYYYNRYRESPDIGDINADGYGDLALRFTDDSLRNKVYIYSFRQVGIADDNLIPMNTSTLSCYPNPFNSSTVITYSLEEGGEIGIYDITGRVVRKYKTGDIKEESITWDGTNANGQKVSSGLYFIKLSNSQRSVSTKLIFMK